MSESLERAELPLGDLLQKAAILADTRLTYGKGNAESFKLEYAVRDLWNEYQRLQAAEQPEDAMRQRVQDVVAGTIDFGTPAAAEIANWILTGDHEPIKQSKEDPNFVDLCFQWLEQNVEFGSDYTLDEMSKSLARFIHKGYEQDAEQAQGPLSDIERTALLDKCHRYLTTAVHDEKLYGPRPSRGMVGEVMNWIIAAVSN